MGDIVLERNLCFVDAPGAKMSRSGQTESVIQYMNQQFQRTLNAVNTVSTDLQGLLGGNGGSQVDAVLYLISEGKVHTTLTYNFQLTYIYSYTGRRYRMHAETF